MAGRGAARGLQRRAALARVEGSLPERIPSMSAGRAAAHILEAFYYHQAEISSALSSPIPSSAQNILSCVGGKVIFSLAGALREMATMEKSQGVM